MRVFNDASFAKLLDCPVTFDGDRTILNVELLKSTAIVSNILDSGVTDHVTTFHTQFLQVRTVLREHLQSEIGDVTLANV
jgi:hypothetical protein